MDIQFYEWFSFFFRWFHVIAAIAWIGASFYFVWLDNSLETPPEWKKEKGIKGDLWAFHGGGIYEVAKYQLAPERMPKTLHWFKWEAYTTWITGTILLCIVYYVKADLYLVASDNWLTTPSTVIPASVLFISSGVLVYEILFRLFSLKQNSILVLGTVLYIALSCYIATKLFNDRAAFLHVGAMIASIMAANVFLGIIPAQKGFIGQLNNDEEPNEEPMLRAKLRSFHNNYFTLPVIFCMISNHYAFLYGHPLNWLVLILLLCLTAYIRHYFNLKHTGTHKPIILVIAAILFAALAIFVASTKSINIAQADDSSTITESIGVAKSEFEVLLIKHCATCHSAQPKQPGFSAPPAGLIFDSLTNAKGAKETIHTVVSSGYMPLGNITGMSDNERARFLSDLAQLK